MLSNLHEIFWEYYYFFFTWPCWKGYILPFMGGWYAIQILNIWMDQKLGLKKLYKKNIMIILGSGGHTGEMLRLFDSFEFKKYNGVYFIRSNDDR